MQASKKELEQQRAAGISRVTWVGFWINFILSVFKISAGISGNSRAVVADGIHSFSDQLTDIAILIGVRFWSAPPDREHPYGHKRLESLISLSLGLILAVVSIAIAVDATTRMGTPPEEKVGSLLALTAALISIISKEILYHWTIRQGRQLKSSAVVANAWHHRSDVFSSIPIAIAVTVVLWFPSWFILDLAAALVVSVFILYASWKICRPAVNVLLDKGADKQLHDKIIEFAGQIPGVQAVHQLRSRYLGEGLCLDLHIHVDGRLTIVQGDHIAHQLEQALLSDAASAIFGLEIHDAHIHVDPWNVKD